MQPAEVSRPDPRLLSISHLTVLDAGRTRAAIRPKRGHGHGQDRISDIDTASPNLLQTHPKDPGDKAVVGSAHPAARVRSRDR